MNLEHMLKKQTDGQIECRKPRSPSAWKQLTERWKSISIVSKTDIRILGLQIDTKLKWESHVKKLQDKMTSQTLTLTKLIAFTWEVTFNKVRHIYKTMIRSRITYESMIWHELKKTKLVSQKTINALAIIQNNCLKRIFEVYKTILIAELETKIHISLIDIHLNELQAKTKIKLQNSRHCQDHVTSDVSRNASIS